MNNPLVDPYLVLNKVYIGGKYLKQAISDTPIEPLNKARTVKICYGVLEKEGFLEHILGANVKKQPKKQVKIILKIALYLLEIMDKHDYMVVDFAVSLAKKVCGDSVGGFVNAFLRSYTLPPMPENTSNRLSVEYGYPLWLVNKLRRSYKSDAEKIMSAPSKGICVRFEKNSEKYCYLPHICTPFENTYIFEKFTRDENFFFGDYTFQSVGSIAICSAIEGCDSLLDSCAAPGGKSVLLSKKCNSVTACELHPHRVELINSYIQRMGAKNITAVQADSSIFNPDFESKFDAVLCDVPCSGTGVINENPDIKLFRKESDIEELTKIQLAILTNCSRYVKSGGRLYYSTCSVLPEENDSVVYSFLEKSGDFVLEIPSSPLEHITTKFGLQFLPHVSLGAGFFLTSFKKR
ncbi:MAG: hypothetical protein J1G05_01380 [Clostridiales bacterium]|nr:hypothetical protein [Clostridiales bacterium]